MLDTFRKSHIEMTHAQAALIQQQAEHEADGIVRDAESEGEEKGGDAISDMVEKFMPFIMAEIQRRTGAGK